MSCNWSAPHALLCVFGVRRQKHPRSEQGFFYAENGILVAEYGVGLRTIKIKIFLD